MNYEKEDMNTDGLPIFTHFVQNVIKEKTFTNVYDWLSNIPIELIDLIALPIDFVGRDKENIKYDHYSDMLATALYVKGINPRGGIKRKIAFENEDEIFKEMIRLSVMGRFEQVKRAGIIEDWKSDKKDLTMQIHQESVESCFRKLSTLPQHTKDFFVDLIEKKVM